MDNTCVNTVCLFPEPTAPGVGPVFFLRELSLMAASHIAPQEEVEVEVEEHSSL